MADQYVEAWRKDGNYLPDFMRDFHDQKDLFKAIHETIAVDKHPYCKNIAWTEGQCYVVDIFLWHLARHGYTIQKSRTKLPFDDIHTTTAEANARMRRHMAAAIGLTPIISQHKESPER